MRHSEFRIGTEFYTTARRWRCTDVGTRTIVAIGLDAPDDSWYNGPPYAVAEVVFDEYALQGTSLSPDDVAFTGGGQWKPVRTEKGGPAMPG